MHVLRCREIRFRAVLPESLQQALKAADEEAQQDMVDSPSLVQRTSSSHDQERAKAEQRRAALLRKKQSIWNVDGEIVKQANIDIR